MATPIPAAAPANPGDSVTWTRRPARAENLSPNRAPGWPCASSAAPATSNTASAGALALFDDFIYDSGIGGTANWEIQGLNNATAYDLYFIAPNDP
ncbi:MAG: hypothetical protein U1F77_01970 [Kiritimatiellia bacterium]